MVETKGAPSSVLDTVVKARQRPASSSSLRSGHAASAARITTISDDSDNAESNHTKSRFVRPSAEDQDVVDLDINEDEGEGDVVFVKRQKNQPVAVAAAAAVTVTQPRERSKARVIPESTTIPSRSIKVAQKRKKDAENLPLNDAIVNQLEHSNPIPIPVPSPRVLGPSESKRCRVLPVSMQSDVIVLQQSKKSCPSTQRKLLSSVLLHSPAYTTTPQDN